MKRQKGFAIVTVLVISLVLGILGATAMYISQEGYTAISAEVKYQVANRNANYGIMKALEELREGTLTCGSTRTYSLDKGSVRVRTVKGGMSCFIWSEGMFANGRSVKVNVFYMGGGSNIAALSFVDFIGSEFLLKNMSIITSTDSECSALSYVNCNSICSDISSYQGCSGKPGWMGCIEGNVSQLDEINPNELLLNKPIEDIQQDLKNRFNEKFAEVESNIPQPPEIVDSNCIITNASSCNVNGSVIKCNASSVDTISCPNGVKISGDSLDIDFWNGNIKGPLVITASSVASMEIGNTNIEGSLFIQVDSIDCGEDCTVINFNNNSTLMGDLVIQANSMDEGLKLSNQAAIEGNVFISLSETSDGETGLELANRSQIKGDVFFKGYELEIEMSNNTSIGGDIVAKGYHEIEIDMANNSSIGGTIYAYGQDELELEASNVAKIGGSGNLLLTDREFELELANNAQLDLGTIAWVGDNLSESEAEIELSNYTSFKGFILFGNMEELELPNNTTIEGALLGYNFGEDGLKMSNSARINGLVVVLNELSMIDLANDAQINGLVFSKILEELELTNNTQIALDVELINKFIEDYGLSDYFKQLKCEGAEMKIADLFKMGVY